MSWLQQLGGLLQQYAGASAHQAPPTAPDDFNQFAHAAPPDALAHGIAHAFRSDQTPPFPNMVGELFGQAPPEERAGLLNTLISTVGPGLLQQVLGGGFGGGQISPHQAAQISPYAVQQLAGLAEQRDPGIVDHLSGYFSQRPGLFQTLGAGALTAALSGIGQRQQQGYYGGVQPASMDPYGDPADGYQGQHVLPSSQDPYRDPADAYGSEGVRPASEDPYGDPADAMAGRGVLPSSQDPYGDPADRP